MNSLPTMTRLTAAIIAIPPQAWTEPASVPRGAPKEAAECSPLPVAETMQPEPSEREDAYADEGASLLEKARLIRTIGSRLVEARKIAGFTQIEAARLLGYPVHKLKKLESAENVVTVAFWLLRRAAEVYQCTVDFIYGLSNDPGMTSLENAYEFGVSKWLFREFEARYREEAAELRAFGKRAAIIERLILEQASLADESAASLAAIRAKNVFFDDLIGGATLVYRINQLSESARTCRLELRRFHRDLGVADMPALRAYSVEVAA
ncbi:MAG: helix-turn-helix transcriptional regulator [Pseudomonadota bacterium]|nr:helix-turn-helix transcriptional regulator [Pseudomonadota bacterium]MDP1905663.1 helix-turn-helix transcriptional regulator [Pseudomonadota bacterium]MDP2353333.1 helix-turn-helix transcriptional regulator [Pseudomonadota bacterium]